MCQPAFQFIILSFEVFSQSLLTRIFISSRLSDHHHYHDHQSPWPSPLSTPWGSQWGTPWGSPLSPPRGSRWETPWRSLWETPRGSPMSSPWGSLWGSLWVSTLPPPCDHHCHHHVMMTIVNLMRRSWPENPCTASKHRPSHWTRHQAENNFLFVFVFCLYLYLYLKTLDILLLTPVYDGVHHCMDEGKQFGNL